MTECLCSSFMDIGWLVRIGGPGSLLPLSLSFLLVQIPWLAHLLERCMWPEVKTCYLRCPQSDGTVYDLPKVIAVCMKGAFQKRSRNTLSVKQWLEWNITQKAKDGTYIQLCVPLFGHRLVWAATAHLCFPYRPLSVSTAFYRKRKRKLRKRKGKPTEAFWFVKRKEPDQKVLYLQMDGYLHLI